MRVRPALFSLLISLLLPLAVEAQPRKVVLLFTGDNGGEISDCGCRLNPAGGLPRRKTALTLEREMGAPVLVLDAGNALFKSEDSGKEPSARPRAELLLEQMEAFGTTAMAVGARDVVLGTDFLKQATRKTKMKLLSANLVDAKGKLLFTPSTVVTLAGTRLGVVGLSPEGAVAPGTVGQPPVPAALAEARRLREKEKVEVVVVLAALPQASARSLAEEAGGAVDFIIQSHEGRIPGVSHREGSVTLIPSGERGRHLGRLELTLEGSGPFVDLAGTERAREGLRRVEENIQRAQVRLASEKDAAARRGLEEALAGLQSRRQALSRQAEARPEGAARTQALSFLLLGPDVAADPALKQRVERIAPPGAEPR